MRERRFLVTSLDDARIELTGSQRHHAVDVLRLAIGADATLFDGRGREVRAKVVGISADHVTFERIEPPRDVHAARLPLALAVATPKGARADWLVEKCAEFGVSRLILIETQRGEVHPGAGKLERWRRKAVEAAKQSGAAVVTRIEAGATIDDICRDKSPGSALVFGATDQSGIGFHACLTRFGEAEPPIDGILCVIGPEGGLTDAEMDLLTSHGAAPVSLGRSILRVETAAVAFAAVWAGFVGGDVE